MILIEFAKVMEIGKRANSEIRSYLRFIIPTVAGKKI
jgi:hypothetical protein